MRMILNKGKWFLLALFVFVLPFCLVGTNSFVVQDELQCTQVLDTSDLLVDENAELEDGDRYGDNNYRLATATTLPSETVTEPATNGSMSTVYWQPNGGTDSSDGSSSTNAVKTFSKVMELLADKGTIYMCGKLTINANTTLDFGGATLILAKDVLSSANSSFFYLDGDFTLTFKNVTIKTQTTTRTDVTIPFVLGASRSSGAVIMDSETVEGKKTESTVKFEDFYSNTYLFSTFKTLNGVVLDGFEAKNYIAYNLIQILNCNLQNCTSVDKCPLIRLEDQSVVTNCYLKGNGILSSGSSNGVIYCYYGVTVTDCEFIENKARYGGVIYIDSSNYSSTKKITNCTFTGNTAYYSGGAIYSYYQCTISNCTFTENKAENSDGGALYASSYSFTIDHCQFTNNESGNRGGAIYVSDPLSLIDCKFEGNIADYGGAVYNSYQITISGETQFIKNEAKIQYSAIYASSRQITMTGAVFDGNKITGTSSSTQDKCVIYAGYVTANNCTFKNHIGIDEVFYLYSNSNSDPSPSKFTGCTFQLNTIEKALMYGSSRYKTHVVIDGGLYGGSSENRNKLTGSTGAVICYLPYSGSTLVVRANAEFSYNTGGQLFFVNGDAITIDSINAHDNEGSERNVSIAIYWDPANSSTTASDSNTGYSRSKAVSTLDKAIELAKNGSKKVIMISQFTISETTMTLDFQDITLVLGSGVSSSDYNAFFYMDGDRTLTLKNVTVTTETETSSDVKIPFVMASNTGYGTVNIESTIVKNKATESTVKFGDYYSDSYIFYNFFWLNGAVMQDVTTLTNYAVYNVKKMTSCTFKNNKVGYYNNRSLVYLDCSNVTVTDCIFYNNDTDSYNGMLYVYYGTVQDCEFELNKAYNGGALYFGSYTSTASYFKAIKCTFTENTARSYGGAIYARYSCTIDECEFKGNTADCGGAIYVNSYYLVITNSDFIENKADCCAVLFVDEDLTMTNCNFDKNEITGTETIISYRCIIWVGYLSRVTNCNFTNHKNLYEIFYLNSNWNGNRYSFSFDSCTFEGNIIDKGLIYGSSNYITNVYIDGGKYGGSSETGNTLTDGTMAIVCYLPYKGSTLTIRANAEFSYNIGGQLFYVNGDAITIDSINAHDNEGNDDIIEISIYWDPANSSTTASDSNNGYSKSKSILGFDKAVELASSNVTKKIIMISQLTVSVDSLFDFKGATLVLGKGVSSNTYSAFFYINANITLTLKNLNGLTTETKVSSDVTIPFIRASSTSYGTVNIESTIVKNKATESTVKFGDYYSNSYIFYNFYELKGVVMEDITLTNRAVCSVKRLTSCTFKNNEVVNNYYGLVCLDNYDNFATDCIFYNNTATNSQEGVLYLYYGTVQDCEFELNKAYNGGALYFGSYTSTASYFKAIKCTFKDNTATYKGGAIYACYSCTIDECEFKGNTADCGGAIYVGSYDLVITNSNFIENKADCFAVLFVDEDLTMTNCNFDKNEITGAETIISYRCIIWVRYSSTVTNCYFTNHKNLYEIFYLNNYSSYACKFNDCKFQNNTIDKALVYCDSNSSYYGRNILFDDGLYGGSSETGNTLTDGTMAIICYLTYGTITIRSNAEFSYNKGGRLFYAGESGSIVKSSINAHDNDPGTDDVVVFGIYWDPSNSSKTASDSNDGSSRSSAVVSFEKATGLAGSNGSIIMISQLTVTTDKTFDFGGAKLVLGSGVSGYNAFFYISVSSNITLTFKEVTVKTETTNKSDVTIEFIEGCTQYYNTVVFAESKTEENKVTESTVKFEDFYSNAYIFCDFKTLQGAVIEGLKSTNLGASYIAYYITEMKSCTFKNNEKGIHFASQATMTDCIYSGNSYYAIFENGGTISNCEFKENKNLSEVCGAVFFGGSSYDRKITNCRFEGNKASASGGAIYSYYGALTIDHCYFIKNEAWAGSAIYISNTQQRLVISDSDFRGNIINNGGGVINASYGILTMSNCEFDGNKYSENATDASKKYLITVGYATVEDCTFLNHSDMTCLFWLESDGTSTFKRCTCKSNTTDKGLVSSASSNVKVIFESGTYGGENEGNHLTNSLYAVICCLTGGSSAITVKGHGAYLYNTGGPLFKIGDGTEPKLISYLFKGNTDANGKEIDDGDKYALIYWDPINGDDNNEGRTRELPVKTLTVATGSAANNDNQVIMLNQYTVTARETLNFSGVTLVLAKNVTGNAFFYIAGNYLLSLENVTVTTETQNCEDVTIPFVADSGNGQLELTYYSSEGQKAVNFEKYYTSSPTGIINCSKVSMYNGYMKTIRTNNNSVFYLPKYVYFNGTKISDCEMSELVSAKSDQGGNTTVRLYYCNVTGCTTQNGLLYYSKANNLGTVNTTIDGGTYGESGTGAIVCTDNTKGGVIYTSEVPGKVTISSATFQYNTGGSLFLLVGNNSNISLSSGTFKNNKNEVSQEERDKGEISKDCYYGAIVGVRWGDSSGDEVEYYTHNITITGGTYSNNETVDRGGVIATSRGEITIKSDKYISFEGNKAPIGGVIFAEYVSKFSMTIGSYKISFSGNKATTGKGGAIYVVNSSNTEYKLEIVGGTSSINISFQNNEAQGDGGAIYSEIPLSIKFCNFANNRSTTGTGGAISASIYGASFVNCSFTNNKSVTSYGGAVYLKDNSASLTNCSFTTNESNISGGALYAGNTIIAEGCSFSTNKAYGTGVIDGTTMYHGGGAIFSTHKATLKKCTFTKNESSSYGGAINVLCFVIENSSFNENSANVGGAIVNWESTDNSISATTTSISFKRNVATEYGGAIWGRLSSIKGTSTYSISFEGNSAVLSGGALYYWSKSEIAFEYCKFANNVSAMGVIIPNSPYSISFVGCEFSKNNSQNCGVIYHNLDGKDFSYTFTNCTFQDNFACTGGVIQISKGTVAINMSSSTFAETDSIEYETNSTIRKGDKMYGGFLFVDSGTTVNLTGVNFENAELKGVGVIYVAENGTLNYKNSTLYNVKSTYGVIYSLGTTTLTDITIAGCNGASLGAIYCGGNGIINIYNLSTIYTKDGTTTYGNENSYGGTIACGELYDTDGNALLRSDEQPLTIAGGIVNFESGNIQGETNNDDCQTIYGGGVYVGANSTFNMRNGKIVASSATAESGQLYIREGTVNLYGDYKYNYGKEVITGGTVYAQVGDSSLDYGVYMHSGILNMTGAKVFKVTNYNGIFNAEGGYLGNSQYYQSTSNKLNNTIIKNWDSSYLYSKNELEINAYIELKNCYISASDDKFIFLINNYATAKIRDCIFENCQANGTFVENGENRPSIFKNVGGTVNFDGCEFRVNKDTLFYTPSSALPSATYYFRSCTINGSLTESTAISGGYMVDINAGTFEMQNATIENCKNVTIFAKGTSESSRNVSIIFNNCSFKNNNYDSTYLLLKLKNVSYEMDNMTWENNTTSIVLEKSSGTINNSTFKNNNTSYYALVRVYGFATGDLNTIRNSSFTKNSANQYGACIAVHEGNFDVYDCEFLNNVSNYLPSSPQDSALGTAIYFANATGSLTLGGTIRITENKTALPTNISTRSTTSPSGGGIYLSENASLIIKQNTVFICNKNYREVGSEQYADNLYIASSNKQILEGDLGDGSDFGLGCNDIMDNDVVSLQEQDALLSKGEDYPVKNKLLEMAHSDNSNYDLRFVYLEYKKNGLVFYSLAHDEDYWVVSNDTVVDYDPSKKQTVIDPILMTGSSETVDEYRIKYESSNGEYTVEKPLYDNIASYSINYIVERVNDDNEWEQVYTTVNGEKTALGGTVYLRILGTRLFVDEYPIAYINYGETLDRANFYGGVVVDEQGRTVVGSWSFKTSNVVGENGKSYKAIFVPANKINLMQSSEEMLKDVSVEVQVIYPYIFYSNGAFRTKYGGDSTTIIKNVDNDLQKILDLMPDGGVLVFSDTYVVSDEQVIEVNNKTIKIVGDRVFKNTSGVTGGTNTMFLIDGVGASLTIKGNIIFDGLAPYSGWWNFDTAEDLDSTSSIKDYVLFEVGKSGNGGALTLGEGVAIRNWTINIEEEDIGLITIFSNASATLEDCEIYGNKILVKSGYNSSVVTNNGTLYIKGGNFMNNILVSGETYKEDRTSASENAKPFGNGGFLVCNTNSTTEMSEGEIYSNRAEFGGAIYVNSNATLILSGGKIYANRGYEKGGALYIESSSNVTFGADCEISGNMSGGSNAIVFNNEYENSTVTVIDGSGTALTGASALSILNAIEEQNESFVNFAKFEIVEDEGVSDHSVVNVIPLFFGFTMIFAFVMVRKFKIKNRKNFKR